MKQAPVARRPEQDGARGRQVGLRVEVLGDPDGMPEHHRVDVVAGIDIDAPHQLDELPRLGLVVAAGLVDIFADEVKGHDSNFRVSHIRESYVKTAQMSIFSNFLVFDIRIS